MTDPDVHPFDGLIVGVGDLEEDGAKVRDLFSRSIERNKETYDSRCPLVGLRSCVGWLKAKWRKMSFFS